MAPDINFDRLDSFLTRICVFDTINIAPTYPRAYLIDALSNIGDASSHPHSSARLHQHVGCKSCDDQIAGKRRWTPLHSISLTVDRDRSRHKRPAPG